MKRIAQLLEDDVAIERIWAAYSVVGIAILCYLFVWIYTVWG